MKKALIVFITLFLVNLCISAQIQRKFFGFTLGQTTKSEVVNYFKNKGKKTFEYTNDKVVVSNIRFGGFEWPTVAFVLYKGKLQMVYFEDNEGESSRDAIEGNWNRLVNSIDKKYSEYLNALLSNEKHLYYSDNTTCISLTYSNFEGKESITLLYSDVSSALEQMKDGEDEL